MRNPVWGALCGEHCVENPMWGALCEEHYVRSTLGGALWGEHYVRSTLGEHCGEALCEEHCDLLCCFCWGKGQII